MRFCISKELLAFAPLPFLLASCASLGPYSYQDHSKPDFPEGTLSDQIEILDLNSASPLNNVCHLKTTRKSIGTLWLGEKTSHGSAALIENRYLITAAHNVFDYPLNKLTSMAVTCGKPQIINNDYSVFLDREKIKSHIYVPRYEFRIPNTKKQYEFDYAFVDLGENVSDHTMFKLGQLNELDDPQSVNIGGFPGSPIAVGDQLYSGLGRITDVDNNILSYSLRTAGGNSGGPIWVETNAKNIIIAIHVKNSGGRLVNEDLITDWKNWKRERQSSER